MFAAASGMATESEVTSCAVSAAPSVAPLAPPADTTPCVPSVAGAAPKENGTLTPHYPPVEGAAASPVTDSDEGTPGGEGGRAAPPANGRPPRAARAAGAPTMRPKLEPVDGFAFPANSSRLLPADTPTPRPRNRRKGVVPTKTE